MDEKRRVLVVDDEPGILHAVADALLDEGYVVFKAANGVDALALALLEPPHAIVSNLMMPHLDGIQLASELRRRGLRIPFVLMSANNEPPGAPGLVFVSKPFELDHLLTVVERAVGIA
jgi:two-component system OmpR family response regulator